MKRTVIFDRQLICGVANVTSNWAFHKNRFIEFAKPYWEKFYGQEGVEDMIGKVNSSEEPLTCRIDTLDFVFKRILMLYCILTERGMADNREQYDVQVEGIETNNHIIDYDAAAERFLKWNTYTPEEETFRPQHAYDIENREKFNTIRQNHLKEFFQKDEAFIGLDGDERFKSYLNLSMRINEIRRVKLTFE